MGTDERLSLKKLKENRINFLIRLFASIDAFTCQVAPAEPPDSKNTARRKKDTVKEINGTAGSSKNVASSQKHGQERSPSERQLARKNRQGRYASASNTSLVKRAEFQR